MGPFFKEHNWLIGYLLIIDLNIWKLKHKYFLGVLTHTTAWDQLQGGDETLKCGFKIKYT